MSGLSEDDLKGLGPNVRKLIKEMSDEMPSEDERKGMGQRLRDFGHILLRTARHVEDGDLDAIGEMLHSKQAHWFVVRYLQTHTISQMLLREAEEKDANRN